MITQEGATNRLITPSQAAKIFTPEPGVGNMIEATLEAVPKEIRADTKDAILRGIVHKGLEESGVGYADNLVSAKTLASYLQKIAVNDELKKLYGPEKIATISNVANKLLDANLISGKFIDALTVLYASLRGGRSAKSLFKSALNVAGGDNTMSLDRVVKMFDEPIQIQKLRLPVTASTFGAPSVILNTLQTENK
jgi:hypothetical protein